jgi:hypothetical protein
LEVNAIGLQFPQLRVHISKKRGGEVQAKLVEETNGGRGDRISYPFVLEPRGQIAYFDAREQVNIVAMIIVRCVFLVFRSLLFAIACAVSTAQRRSKSEPRSQLADLASASVCVCLCLSRLVSSRLLQRNPTVLMMGFMGLMAWGMPKMMENMDPEELKKMQEEMADSPMSSMLGGGVPGAPAAGKGSKKKSAASKGD